METRPNAVWATSAWPKPLLSMLRGPGDDGDPLHDPARARVDGDEVRLEVGGHERDDASARRGGEEPLRQRRRDERCRSGDEEVTALHAPDYGRPAAERSMDLDAGPIRIPGMDLRGPIRRTVGSEWQRDGEMSGRSCAARRAGPRLPSTSCSGSTGDERTRPPTSSSTTPRPPRTSPRRRSSPRSATSTASIAAGRSLRGCTASSSTARSTTPAPERCAPRPTSQPSLAAPAAAPGAPEESLLAAIGRLPPDQRAVIVLRYLLEYTPGEIATMLNVPRGTVNSRLRRGLDEMQAVERDA